MTLEKMQFELIKAMKSKNKIHKAVVSDVISTAKNIAIEQKCKDNISEEIVDKAILKIKKIYQEQIDTCPAERTELLEQYKERMKYIELYAPHMMTAAEVEATIKYLITCEDVPLTKGGVMKAAMAQLKGKAEGKTINQIVEKILKILKNE